MNPLTSGWSAGNAGSSAWGPNSGPPPSVFGALPSLGTANAPRVIQPDSVTYLFTDFNSTILNCAVVGPQGRGAYRIVTDTAAPSTTVLKDNESRTAAMVQWQPAPTVEVREVADKQRVRDWVKLSSDRQRRIMVVKGVQFAWSPIDGFICLYKAQSTAPRVLARIARARTDVLLELTQEALQLGLLESAVVATFLFICGANID